MIQLILVGFTNPTYELSALSFHLLAFLAIFLPKNVLESLLSFWGMVQWQHSGL